MDKISRLLMCAASLVLASIYFLPLWQVKLIAPQYPEGLRMIIWLARLSGGGADDLYNINLLNQYIGMQPINAASVPELTIMPIFIGIMVVLGMVAAFSKIKILPVAWVSLLVVAGIICFVDFYRFEYSYGHHLNPHAPIKVPGLSYQPPLVGTEHLLNFTASSYPQSGFFVGGLAIALAAAAALLRMRWIASKMVAPKALLLAGLTFGLTLPLTACGTAGPVPINFGKDVCAFCDMTIVHPRYWAELVTDKGKVFRFDSVTCLSSFMARTIKGKALWVANFARPDEGIDATSACYLYNPKLSGPMGKSLAAFKTLDALVPFRTADGGVKSFADIQTLVQTGWLKAQL